MSRPRTPTKVLKLRGAFSKHPERARERENEPANLGPLGSAPRALDDSARERWRQIAKMAPWLEYADRLAVEELAKLWAKSRRNELAGGDGKRIDWLMSRLGMTASDRSKVRMPNVGDQKKKSLLA